MFTLVQLVADQYSFIIITWHLLHRGYGNDYEKKGSIRNGKKSENVDGDSDFVFRVCS